jgi:tetratricopeptide (TPR) repeat protein
MLNKCQPLIEQLAARHPENLSYQQGVGAQHNACGQMFAGADQHEQALEHYRKALEIDRAITTAESSNALFRRELAIQFGNVGTELLALKNPGEALDNFKQALAIHESMVAADPNDSVALRNTGVIHRSLGTVLATTDPAAALNEYQNALRIFGALVLKDSGNADFRRQQAHTYLLLSGFHLDHGHATDALASAQGGIRIAEPLVTNAPKNAAARNTLALLDIQSPAPTQRSRPPPRRKRRTGCSLKVPTKKRWLSNREMKSAGTLLPPMPKSLMR